MITFLGVCWWLGGARDTDYARKNCAGEGARDTVYFRQRKVNGRSQNVGPSCGPCLDLLFPPSTPPSNLELFIFSERQDIAGRSESQPKMRMGDLGYRHLICQFGFASLWARSCSTLDLVGDWKRKRPSSEFKILTVGAHDLRSQH